MADKIGRWNYKSIKLRASCRKQYYNLHGVFNEQIMLRIWRYTGGCHMNALETMENLSGFWKMFMI